MERFVKQKAKFITIVEKFVTLEERIVISEEYFLTSEDIFVTSMQDLLPCVMIWGVWVFVCFCVCCKCVCVCHPKKPFASELETNTNEMNVSQVSATLYKFIANM